MIGPLWGKGWEKWMGETRRLPSIDDLPTPKRQNVQQLLSPGTKDALNELLGNTALGQ